MERRRRRGPPHAGFLSRDPQPHSLTAQPGVPDLVTAGVSLGNLVPAPSCGVEVRTVRGQRIEARAVDSFLPGLFVGFAFSHEWGCSHASYSGSLKKTRADPGWTRRNREWGPITSKAGVLQEVGF